MGCSAPGLLRVLTSRTPPPLTPPLTPPAPGLGHSPLHSRGPPLGEGASVANGLPVCPFSPAAHVRPPLLPRCCLPWGGVGGIAGEGPARRAGVPPGVLHAPLPRSGTAAGPIPPPGRSPQQRTTAGPPLRVSAWSLGAAPRPPALPPAPLLPGGEAAAQAGGALGGCGNKGELAAGGSGGRSLAGAHTERKAARRDPRVGHARQEW